MSWRIFSRLGPFFVVNDSVGKGVTGKSVNSIVNFFGRAGKHAARMQN